MKIAGCLKMNFAKPWQLHCCLNQFKRVSEEKKEELNKEEEREEQVKRRGNEADDGEE